MFIMNKTSKNITSKKSKSERLGWESYSSQVAVEMKTIVGHGIRVEKNTYCNPSVNYRKIVP